MGCGASSQSGGGEKGNAPDAKPTKKDKEAEKSKNEEFEQTMKFLQKVPLFKRLPPADLPTTAAEMVRKSWNVGDSVIKQGDAGQEFFVIIQGAAQVLIQKEGESDSKEVAKLKTGDYFGEGALLRDEPRTATIKVTEKLDTISMTQQKFQELGLKDRLQFAKRQAVAAVAEDDGGGKKAEGPTQKNEEEQALCAQSLKANVNLNALVTMDDDRVKQLVDCAWKQSVEAGEEIIKEGDPFADYFYIVQEGEFEVLINKDEPQSADSAAATGAVHAATCKKGDSFGELALLYYAPRAATVKAKTSSVVWVIGRSKFKAILLKASDAKIQEYAKILSNVDILDGLLSDEMTSIAEALVEMHFHKDEVILQEGEMGSTFFILYDGEVEVFKGGEMQTKLTASSKAQSPEFFGERALLKNEPRAATVKVASTTAKALALDRDSFEMLLGPLEDIMTQNEQKAAAGTRKSMAVLGKGHNAFQGAPERGSFFPAQKEQAKPEKIDRADLRMLGLLGCGGFGKVTLEEHKPTGKTYALKALSKGFIVKTGMQASVMNEKHILSMTDSPFIIKLHETYRGTQSLYFLLEPCLGGELYATYHRRGFHGSENHAKFYSASVILAFEHLHMRRVLYRDLKPENVLLDGQGYAKLTDMGLAKFVIGKTYTTCGTPDYFAPEVISSSGHNRAVDWWTLGILIFELMTGNPPFESADPMGTYMKVMQGIEKVRFPSNCKDSIEDLVKGLCKKDPSERIPMRSNGVEGLKNHAWFSTFGWKALIERSADTPYKPKVKSATDLANFSAREEDAPRHMKYVDDGSGWDADF